MTSSPSYCDKITNVNETENNSGELTDKYPKWCDMVQSADENDSDLRYSEVPLKGKIKHLSKYWGVVNTGRPLQVKYSGGRVDPCGVDAYESLCPSQTGGEPVPAR